MQQISLILIGLALLISGCFSETDYNASRNKSTLNVDSLKNVLPVVPDSSFITIISMAVSFDSLTSVMHIAGELKDNGKYLTRTSAMFGSEYSYMSSSRDGGNPFEVFYKSNNRISGRFSNIYFSSAGGDKREPIAHDYLIISAVQYLPAINLKNEEGLLVYSVWDFDSNGDGVLSDADIESRYISRGDGSAFHKISADLHDIIDVEAFAAENRLYFRTIEDSNGDGRLRLTDKVHHYYIDFDIGFEVVEYFFD